MRRIEKGAKVAYVVYAAGSLAAVFSTFDLAHEYCNNNHDEWTEYSIQGVALDDTSYDPGWYREDD